MKKWLLFIFLLLSHILKAQIITTVSGTSGGTLVQPEYLIFDIYHNLYIPDCLGDKILKIDTAGIVTRFAGTGIAGYSGDNGQATLAKLYQPTSVATDKFGNVYISDVGNNRIRKVNVTTGIITTIAGGDTAGYSGNGGLATVALLFHPTGLCFDKYWNLYFTDAGNHRIRKIDTVGIISLVGGNGIIGTSGNGGPATGAEINPLYNICVDVFGNLYFGDQGNQTVRKITTSGIIKIVAGDSSGTSIFSGDGVPGIGAPMTPEAIGLDKNGELIIADTHNNRVRKIDSLGIIHTIAGNGIYAFSGDYGPAVSASIPFPGGVTFDYCNNLFVSEIGNPCIRKVSFNPTCNLSVPEEKADNEITIFPNPASEEITITGLKTDTKWGLFNIKSIIEQQGILKKGINTLSIEALSPGLYILELTMDDGTRIMKKIIKM